MQTQNIQALNQSVFCQLKDARQIDPEDSTAIVIPDTVDPESPYFLVLSVGANCTIVKPGDKVIFDIAGALPFNEKGFVFIQESNIVGRID